MGNSKINNMLIPNVSKLPKHKNVNTNINSINNDLNSLEKKEFENLLKDEIGKSKESSPERRISTATVPTFNDERFGIQLSQHAAKRLSERSLDLDGNDFFKLKDAIDKLKIKGGRDSLVITPKAAYIVDVENSKIVTAIDKGSIAENIFTKIDSTIVID